MVSRPHLTSTTALSYVAVSVAFFLSGFAALLYQTAWLRQFSIVFGTSEIAIATVLAAYMGGLGIGAALAAHFLPRLRRPVWTYGLLEAAIAISALAVPFGLAAADHLHTLWLGGQPAPPDSGGFIQLAYYVAVSFVVLGIPTACMGATLPLLTRHLVKRETQIGPGVAWLYGINTLGAVLGTLVAAFLLLPAIGLQTTVYVGVVVNLIVFLIAWFLTSLDKQAGQADGDTDPPAAEPRSQSWPHPILPIMMLSGCNAFLLEVLWTRMLGHVLGGTVYAFATMLASFLTGIALGGLLAGRFASSRERAAFAFVIAQLGIGVCSAGVYYWLQGYEPTTVGLASNVSLAMLVMLPSTLFIGATFPLAVRMATAEATATSGIAAKTYAWNTIGAILGATLAGFFLIPALGFSGAMQVAVIVSIVLAILVSLLPGQNRKLAMALGVTTVIVAVVYRPEPPMGLIDTSVIDDNRGGAILHYSVGRSATVYMKEREGHYYLRTNGLPEAFIEPRGAPPVRHTQKWLTALPLLARPETESMLIIGFGGGVAVEGVSPSVREIDVIELEPEVIAANQTIADRRRYDPLADPRVNVVNNDARNALALTDKRYGVIVSQPSHPWTAGASHLYTAEFLALAKSRLKRDGVLLQWINSLFIDEALLKSLTATLYHHFSNVRLYQPTPSTLMFLAADGPLNVEQDFQMRGFLRDDNRLHFTRLGIGGVEDLLMAVAADNEGLSTIAHGAPINTDDENAMALFSYADSGGLTERTLANILEPYDPLLHADSWVFSALQGVDFPYLGNRLIYTGFQRRALGLRDALRGTSAASVIEGFGLRFQGKMMLSERSLIDAIELDPSNQQAIYALLWRYLGQLAEGKAPKEIEALATKMQGVPKAIIAGWGMGMRRQWQALAELDSELAKAKPNSVWYPEAVKLRADWRIQGGVGDAPPLEALALLDEAIVAMPLTDLLVIRAAAAVRLRDNAAFIETAQVVFRRMTERVDRIETDDASLAARELKTMRQRAIGFNQRLQADDFKGSSRAAEVASNFRLLAARLNRLG